MAAGKEKKSLGEEEELVKAIIIPGTNTVSTSFTLFWVPHNDDDVCVCFLSQQRYLSVCNERKGVALSPV